MTELKKMVNYPFKLAALLIVEYMYIYNLYITYNLPVLV